MASRLDARCQVRWPSSPPPRRIGRSSEDFQGQMTSRAARPEHSYRRARLRWQVNCATRAVGGRTLPVALRETSLTEIWIVFAIIAVAIVLFVWDRLPVVIVGEGVGLSLWASGMLTLNQALAGLRRPGGDVHRRPVRRQRGPRPHRGHSVGRADADPRRGEDSRTRLLVLNGLLVALLTALISVNGAVAALLPVVVVMAVRLRRKPSQLLMPLVFSAHAGSMLALTGTPVNVLVRRRRRMPAWRLRLLRIRARRRAAAVGTLAIIVLFGQKLLPGAAAVDAVGFQPPRPHAGGAVRPGHRHVPAAPAGDLRADRPADGRRSTSARLATCGSSPSRTARPATAAPAHLRRGRLPARLRRRRSRGAMAARAAPGLPAGDRRRGRADAVQPQLRALPRS